MSGEELRPFLLHLDESLAKTAKKLGIPAQNLSKVLKTKDIKTGLIERLAKIYNMPVGYFFNEEPARIEVKHNSAASLLGDASINVGDPTTRFRYLEALIEEKEERIKELKEHIELLKSI